MAEPTAIRVEILGQVFTVRSDDGEDHVRAVAREVDERMRVLLGSGHVASSYVAAVLTALNMASECQKLMAEKLRITEALSRLTARLAEAEAALGDPGKGDG